MKTILDKLRPLSGDFVIVLGLASVVFGFHQIYSPLGFILGGGLAVWLAIPVRKKSLPNEREKQ